MYTGLIDTINSMLQGTMFIIAADYCVQKEYKKSKLKIFILTIGIWLLMTINTKILGNTSLSIVFIHIQEILFLSFLAYRKDKLGAITGFSIIYILIGINAVISFVLFLFLVSYTRINLTLINILVLYIPQFIASFFILKNMKFIYKLNLVIRSRTSYTITVLVTSVVFDFMMSFLFIFSNKDNPLFKWLTVSILGVFIISITLYFTNIHKKSKEIQRLNRELEKKINELKKIKHDYGSQISYLYGAYLMQNYDKLGQLLKDIIDGNNISSHVKVLTSDESIISQVINSTDLKEVDVLIDEKANLKDVAISELEVQKILSNIVRNSIEALKGKGLLMIRTYYNYNYLVINIQNDGPKIEDSIIENIFEEGFSTKENKNGDNGFGLYIVKEIVDNNNGSITVNSNEDVTTFIINLPLHI